MGLVGRKCGMTRVFTDDGVSIPVTVIEAQPNRITQVKTVETDGYRALQVAAGSRKASRVSKVSLTAIRRTSRSARNYVLICLPKARR
jgi:large subunit ribosomal protein L3